MKTNLGHLEGARGIAGLIKLVLSLHHEGLPGLIHFQNPEPPARPGGDAIRADPRTRPGGAGRAAASEG